MATFIADTYNKIPILSDAGNLVMSRFKYAQSAALAVGDIVLLGKVPPYAMPLFFHFKLDNLGSGTKQFYIDNTLVGTTNYPDGIHLEEIVNIEPTEQERDFKMKITGNATSANPSVIIDIGYIVTQL